MEGWIKLHRKIEDHWMWKNPSYVKAWVYILFRANITEGKAVIGSKIEKVEAGSFITSISNFSEATGLSTKQTRAFWELLEKDKQIVKNTTNKWTKLTVCNYEQYQIEGQTKDKQRASRRATGEEERKEEKEKSSKKESLKIPENLDYPKFRKKWEGWISYRREMGFKTAIGTQQRNLSTVNRLSDGDVKTAVLIIQQSIDQNYQGLFALKNNQSVNGQKGYTPRHGVRDLDFDDVKSTKIKIKQQ